MDKKNDIKHIYFFENHEKSKKLEYKSKDNLKLIKNIEKKDDNRIIFSINLYELEIDINKIINKEPIVIEFLYETNKFYIQYLIDNIDDMRYIFSYNTKINKRPGNSFFFYINRENVLTYNILFEEKYKLFIDNIDMNNNKQLRKDFVYCTQNIIKTDIKYTFPFFTSLFNYIDGDNKDDIINHIDLFNINKVDDQAYKNIKFSLTDKMKKTFINYYKILKNSINSLGEEKINDYILFLLYFVQYFLKAQIYKIFEDKNLNKYIFEVLLEEKKNPSYSNIFADINLSKNIINEFLKIAKKFEDVNAILNYNKNFLERLELINSNFDFIINFKKEEKDQINLEYSIKANKNDDLNKIKEQLSILLNKEKSNNLIGISPAIFQAYIFLHKDNIEELFCLNKIINMVCEYKKNLKKTNIRQKIFDALKKFVIKGELKNIDLLIFFENIDIELFFKKENHIKKETLKNIEINKINDEFIKKFRNIKWCQIFNIEKKELVEEILLLIQNMKDFIKFFSLFDFDKDIDEESFKKILDKFYEFWDNYDEKQNQDFLNIIVKIIYYSNTLNLEINNLIEEIIYNVFTPDFINQIYYNIYSKSEYKKINNKLKNFIFDFYEKNKEFINPIYIAFRIECNEYVDEKFLDNYDIEIAYLYNIKDIDKFKFLEGIIDKKLMEKQILVNYINKNRLNISNILKNIKKGEINYNQINIFFLEKEEEILKKRIKLMAKFIDKSEEYEDLFHELEQKIKEINIKIDKLKVVKIKLKVYYPTEKSIEIQNIEKVLDEIESKKIEYFLNNEEIEKYLNLQEIKDLPLNPDKSNIFFKSVFNMTKKNHENEKEAVDITKKKINIYIKILNSNNINEDYINKLNILLNDFSENEYNKMDKVIDELIIYNEENIIIDKAKMIYNLKCIWKKDLLYNFAKLFNLLIEKNKIKKGEFYAINEMICQHLKTPKNLKVIELYIELYKNFKIEFTEKNNFQFYKKIKLVKNMNEIVYFLLSLEKNKMDIKLNRKYSNDVDKYYRLNELKGFIDSIISLKNEDLDFSITFLKAINESNEYKEDFVQLIDESLEDEEEFF